MASPSNSIPESLLLGLSQLELLQDQSDVESNPRTECSICQEFILCPTVLPCLHTICQPCLENGQGDPEKVQCPKCKQDDIISPQDVSGLVSDFTTMNNVLETPFSGSSNMSCTGCKTKDSSAVAHCYDCKNFLCGNCVTAHLYMHIFEDHQLVRINEQGKDDLLYCFRHNNEMLCFFCKTCDILICKECANVDHPRGFHHYEYISEAIPREIELIKEEFEMSKSKVNELRKLSKTIEDFSSHIKVQFHQAQKVIEDTYEFYVGALNDQKTEKFKELDQLHDRRKNSLKVTEENIKEGLSKVNDITIFIENMLKYSDNSEILMFKQILNSKLVEMMSYNPEVNIDFCDLEFVSNYQAIQAGVKNTFGYIDHTSRNPTPQPIARPNSMANPDQIYQNGHVHEPNLLSSNNFGSTNSLGSFSTGLSDINTYERWSNGHSANILQNGADNSFRISPSSVTDLSPEILTVNAYPLKSEVKRQKMIYHCKFGEFGTMEGQFTEPSGVATNAQSDIIVADTNNHRIQIFDNEGRFKFRFGECGKRDGQLMYPNRVAVIKTSGDIIVTERSPTHQVQIYNQYGQFVRKFGANELQHPRAVAVDSKGRIIIVECKVMRVIIFDQRGTVLKKNNLCKHLQFPNGVAVNENQEIFISDNRAHCVKVFNYDGDYLRQIGGEGLTNYPIGVAITPHGEILVADNHNNFNITLFTQHGQLLNATESKVKHAQCFDVAVMDDGSAVLTSKDYRLYIYRYLAIPGLTL